MRPCSFDEGVVDIRGESISLMAGYPETLATDGATSVGLIHHKLAVDRGISFGRASQILSEKAALNETAAPYQHEGFYRSRRHYQGREAEGLKACAMLVQVPTRAFALNAVPLFKVCARHARAGAPCHVHTRASS